MTYTAYQKFPLVIVAKGKTSRCTEKFKENNCDCDQTMYMFSENGWTTVEVMKQYLNWLSKEMGNEPFALIIDCFKAHIDQTVKDLATKLQITLTIVPACGTGLYQPSTAKWIVKAKLRAEERVYGIVRDEGQIQDRYRLVLNALKNAWEAISPEALMSAWELPGLDKLMKT